MSEVAFRKCRRCSNQVLNDKTLCPTCNVANNIQARGRRLNKKRRGECCYCNNQAEIGKTSCTKCTLVNASKRLNTYYGNKSKHICVCCRGQVKEGKTRCAKCNVAHNHKEQERSRNRKLNGMCRWCNQPTIDNTIFCKSCVEKLNTNNKIRSTNRVINGLCRQCGNLSTNKTYCEECLIQRRSYRVNLKTEVILHYGGICTCGISAFQFLNIDHINDDGAKHRKLLGHNCNMVLYRWLKRNNFPDGFQCLCWTCNQLKAIAKRNANLNQNQRAIRHRERRHNNKLIVMRYYGDNKCQCCNDYRIDALTIDHIDGGGLKHRRQFKLASGGALYKWLIDNNFPSGYRVLCWNCNCGRSLNNGICPHLI